MLREFNVDFSRGSLKFFQKSAWPHGRSPKPRREILNFKKEGFMRRTALISVIIMFALVAFVGCQSMGASRSTGDVVDDTTINGEVKAKLLGDDVMKGIAVNVDTYQGIVTLRGNVDTQDQIRRATEIAKSVRGVRRVENKLMVKGR
jgi:hyperosmotically inducible protein